jgi:hypothetical protein
VRNPWDRVASYYRWLRGQGFDHPAVHLAKAESFAGFLRHPQTQASLRAWPARRYMQDAAGRERCDLYIRLEHFAADAQPLFDHLGFDLKLPRVNASEGAGAVYTPELRDVVAEVCAEDIARFGYGYDGP